MSSVSSTDQLERIDSLNAILDAGDRMTRFFADISDEIDQQYLYRYIVKNYLQLSDLNIDRLFKTDDNELDKEINPQDLGFEDRTELVAAIQEMLTEDPELQKEFNEFMEEFRLITENQAKLQSSLGSYKLTESDLTSYFDKDKKKFKNLNLDERESHKEQSESEDEDE